MPSPHDIQWYPLNETQEVTIAIWTVKWLKLHRLCWCLQLPKAANHFLQIWRLRGKDFKIYQQEFSVLFCFTVNRQCSAHGGRVAHNTIQRKYPVKLDPRWHCCTVTSSLVTFNLKFIYVNCCARTNQKISIDFNRQ